jgi:hypothetical protein
VSPAGTSLLKHFPSPARFKEQCELIESPEEKARWLSVDP